MREIVVDPGYNHVFISLATDLNVSMSVFWGLIRLFSFISVVKLMGTFMSRLNQRGCS